MEPLAGRIATGAVTALYFRWNRVPGRKLHALFYEYPFAGYQVMTRLSRQIFTRLRETRKELRWLHQSAR